MYSSTPGPSGAGDAASFGNAPAPPGFSSALAATAVDGDLAQEIFETMIKVHGEQPGFRPVHAKGIVCQGTFEPSPLAAGLSKAPHFQASTPLTVRFSDGATDPMIPDNPETAVRAAWRFASCCRTGANRISWRCHITGL